MKRRFPFLFTLAANDAEALAVAANADGGGAVFAIAQADSMFIPYGSYPHKVGVQVFDKAAAEGMIAANRGLLATFGKWLTGRNDCPVYVGHPDLPGSKDSDKKAYGWVDGMTAEPDGMRLSVRWSAAGKELVENAHYRFYSPMWWLQKTKRGMVPVSLKSVGLTNDPNIPVPALANESMAIDAIDAIDSETSQETEPNATTMNPELLAALGLPDTATPEDCLAAITALKDAAAAAKTAEDEAANACATAKDHAATAANELATARAALSVAANHAVQAAVTAGQLAPVEAEAKTAELIACNDLASALQDLGKLPPKIKTASTTGDLGNAKTRLVTAANDEGAAARAERAQLVANEYERTHPGQSEGKRKRLAWERAAAKNPALFGKQSPDATA